MSDHARVLFFATTREKTGVRETSIEFLSGAHISDIKNLLVELYPNLKLSMETIIVAMNHEFAFDETIVPDGAEIAIFPPVSGGEADRMNFPTITAVVDQNININEILEKITLNTTGAACVFSGIVRGVTNRGTRRDTDLLEYEAYQAMAESKMLQISEEIRMRWKDVEGIAMVQRIGKLLPGTVSVACLHILSRVGYLTARFGIDV
jgi:molybdopterin synthase catalytic subunit